MTPMRFVTNNVITKNLKAGVFLLETCFLQFVQRKLVLSKFLKQNFLVNR